MDKRTLELLHSKLSDLDSKIAEISSLRQQIFDILKDHESKQQAAADATVLVDKAKEKETKDEVSKEAEDQLDLSQLQAKVDETVEDDLAEDDDDAIDSIGDIDSEKDIEIDGEKAKEDIAREAISLEAHKLMESTPDDVEPMRKAEETLEDDIQGENIQDQSNTFDMVNNPETISTIDPTIIPQKVLDEDLDVGKDSDLAKVNDAFAEMDRIEPQENIDKLDEELSKEHDHSDLVGIHEESNEEEKPADEIKPEEKVEDKIEVPDSKTNEAESEPLPKEEPEEEPEAKAEDETEIDAVVEDDNKPLQDTEIEVKANVEDKKVEDKKDDEVKTTGFAAKIPSAPTSYDTPSTKFVEEEAVVVQPRPIQHTPTQPTHPSNQGTINAGRPSTGMKVDEMLSRQNSRNLYKAFTLNDKFRFRRELFHGKDVEMAEALDRISMMDNYNQAEDYFYETLGMNPNNEDVKDFMMIIQNHFA